ncbi:MAG: 2-C-methyl-D-erythritol 4-phosphate cytidylyltransferase [Chloroflexi bacterium]|nr:2-C-methyl-D-erythritol 4-phosphate cytidylyltransferase [Chloroflexota bacterium]
MALQLGRVGAVIAAAGISSRLGTDKMLGELGGIPVLAHTLSAFQSSAAVHEIVVVAAKANLQAINRLTRDFSFAKVAEVLAGGARRRDSVWNGISALSDCEWVVIHDGARPFVDPEIIENGLREALGTGSAVAAVPVKDTIKIADSSLIVRNTLPREFLWSVQTPQVFRGDVITDAHLNVIQDATDDAQLVELRGWPVKIYMGSYDNIKITTPEDMDLARLILSRRKGDAR